MPGKNRGCKAWEDREAKGHFNHGWGHGHLQGKNKDPDRLMGLTEGKLQSRWEDPAISLGLVFSPLPTPATNISV